MNERAALGAAAESLVARYLEEHGYELLARNARVGRLELDIVARRGALVAFCEVRARSSRALLDPVETIDLKKRARLRRAAELWLRRQPEGRFEEIRFDAASVLFDGEKPALAYYEDAF